MKRILWGVASVALAYGGWAVNKWRNRPPDLAALDGQLGAARQEWAVARREVDVLTGSATKNAATAYEVTQARERVDRATLQIS